MEKRWDISKNVKVAFITIFKELKEVIFEKLNEVIATSHEKEE